MARIRAFKPLRSSQSASEQRHLIMAMTIDREDLKVSLLRTFFAVGRHGSMGRAAANATTQPTVSQRILRLKKIIGRRLFSRSRGGLKLTGHGELLRTLIAP